MKSNAKETERSVQTLFRVALKNHMELSKIADMKANILLSVNAIVVSLVISNLLTKLDNPNNGYLIVPAAIFIAFSVASMIIAVLITRPHITVPTSQRELEGNTKPNLLFFGNFRHMTWADYQTGMRSLLLDKNMIHNSLTNDLFHLGSVLHRKYKMLRYTYLLFICGFVLSILAFLFALMWTTL